MHVGLYIHFLVLSCVAVSLLCYCTYCVMSMMNKAVLKCLFIYLFCSYGFVTFDRRQDADMLLNKEVSFVTVRLPAVM